MSNSSSYKKLTGNLRQLEAKRRTYRRILQQYERIKVKFIELVKKIDSKEVSPSAEKNGIS